MQTSRSPILQMALVELVRALVKIVPRNVLAQDLGLSHAELDVMLRDVPKRQGRQPVHEWADLLACNECGTQSRPDDVRAELTCPECGSTDTTWIAVERGDDP